MRRVFVLKSKTGVQAEDLATLKSYADFEPCYGLMSVPAEKEKEAWAALAEANIHVVDVFDNEEIDVSYPVYFTDGEYRTYCLLSQLESISVEIYPQRIVIEKKKNDIWPCDEYRCYKEMIRVVEGYKEITELEFQEKLHLAKSLI